MPSVEAQHKQHEQLALYDRYSDMSTLDLVQEMYELDRHGKLIPTDITTILSCRGIIIEDTLRNLRKSQGHHRLH